MMRKMMSSSGKHNKVWLSERVRFAINKEAEDGGRCVLDVIYDKLGIPPIERPQRRFNESEHRPVSLPLFLKQRLDALSEERGRSPNDILAELFSVEQYEYGFLSRLRVGESVLIECVNASAIHHIEKAIRKCQRELGLKFDANWKKGKDSFVEVRRVG